MSTPPWGRLLDHIALPLCLPAQTQTEMHEHKHQTGWDEAGQRDDDQDLNKKYHCQTTSSICKEASVQTIIVLVYCNIFE